MTTNDLWQAALGEIEISTSKANFITWFNGTKLMENKEGTVVLAVPSSFNKDWLENKYYKTILKSLRNVSPEIKKIEFVILSNQLQKTKLSKKESYIKEPQILREQTSFQEINNFSEIDKITNLNKKYTFDNFVVGSFNELAYAAGQAIIKNLGKVYNPLFIYGGVGLGKTHLLQAIGNEIVKNSNNKVKYVNAEKFTIELIDYIQNKRMKDFKNLYRDIDLLIVDDVQFIAGKEKVQDEFFHTFNALYHINKQIILSSDRSPKSISTLEDRLKSRFEGGMIADISYPDIETRIAILKLKLKNLQFELSNEILTYIASHITRNIRELEGVLNRIVANAKMKNNIPTENQIKKDLQDFISVPKKKTNYKIIINAVSEFYDIEIKELINKSRKKEIVWPRQIAMYLLREEIKSSFPFIGEKLGGRDHTTVMYACEKLRQKIKENNSLSEEINLIKEKIYNI